MAFNLGAFAGGAAKGIESGVNLQDQLQQRKLREAQYNAFNAQNLGQQAFTNSLIPGMTPMPIGANPQASQPLLSRLPLIGPIGQELGLWGGVPGGQGAPPSPGMPSPGGQPPAMASQPPAPSPAAPPGGQPAGPPDMIQAVAQAVDQANPGLRMSNPAAFSAAVMLGVEHAKAQAATQLDTDFKRAQITGMGSENKLREAQALNIPAQTDLTREQIKTQQAETDIKKEELKLTGPKLKLKQAEIKLKEAEQDAVQSKLRLEEAEINAKVGDYKSQREWRDAQIAKARADRQLEIRKQKTQEAKTQAEMDKMITEGKVNEARAGYLNRKDLGPEANDKRVMQELTKAQVMLRHHQDMKARLLTSINPNDKRIKALVAENDSEITRYAAEVAELEGELSSNKKPETTSPQATPVKTEVPPARQQELGKISNKFLELAKRNDMEGAKRLKDLMVSKGIPQHEIEWALQNARQMGTASSNQPQVPQTP